MTEKEKSALLLFNEKVEELMSCKFFQEKGELKIDFTEGTPKFKIGDKEPDEDLIRSLLMCFRIFYVKGPINFKHIHNILWKNVESEERREAIKFLHKMYYRILKKGSGLVLKIDEKTVKPQKNINAWLYGYYFHLDDEEKRKELEYFRNVTGDVVKFFFIREIVALVNVIIYLNEIVKKVLKSDK